MLLEIKKLPRMKNVTRKEGCYQERMMLPGKCRYRDSMIIIRKKAKQITPVKAFFYQPVVCLGSR
jgi:hypothetical protein